MKVVSVRFRIKPQHVDEFIKVSLGDAKGSVENEPGCYRFDVFQDESDPSVVCFYEVYQDDAAFQAHTEMPHYLEWRGAFKDEWRECDTDVVLGRSICPPDEEWVRQDD